MRRRSAVAAGAVWLGVVVAASGLTWTVIDAAGQKVLTPDGPTAGPPVPAPSSQEGGRTSGGPRSPSARRTSPTPGAPTAHPSTGRTPSASPVPVTPSASPPPVTPSASPPAVTGGAAAGRTGSWEGGPGLVTARCAGGRISLVAASPNNGWRVSVRGRGPEEIEVEFQPGGEDGATTDVVGRCSGGVPRFGTGSGSGETEREAGD